MVNIKTLLPELRKLVLALGERGVAGTDEKHFGRPSGIAFLPDRCRAPFG